MEWEPKTILIIDAIGLHSVFNTLNLQPHHLDLKCKAKKLHKNSYKHTSGASSLMRDMFQKVHTIYKFMSAEALFLVMTGTVVHY